MAVPTTQKRTYRFQLIQGLFYSAFILFAYSGFSQNYQCTEMLTSSDGLSQSTINCILQDDDGLLWLGTQDGLNLYDGNEFIFFQNHPGDTNSLSDNYILSICEGPDKNIWIGTMSGGLNKFDKKTRSCERFQKNLDKPDGISDNTIWAVESDAKGNIYAGTNNGLNVLDQSTNQFITYNSNDTTPNSIPSNMIISLLADSKKNIWVGTNKGLAIFNEDLGDFKTIPLNEQIQDDNLTIWTIAEFQGNQIMIGTKNGFWKIDNSTKQFETYKPGGVNTTIWSLAPSGKNSLLAGTKQGLYYINHITGKSEEITFGDGTSNPPGKNNVWCVTKDKAGFYWAGGDDGLMKITVDQNPFKTFGTEVGNELSLSEPSVNAILVDNGQNLWIGTDGGGLHKLGPGKDKFIVYKESGNQQHSLSNNRVWALLEDKEGIIWAGTYGAGLNRFNKQTNDFKSYQHDNSANSISNDRVLALYEDNHGTIWIGTRGGGLNKFDKEKEIFTTYLHNPDDSTSLISNTVLSINEDRDGNLWIGTYLGGLSLFDKATQSFTNYCFHENENGCISNNNVWSIHFDKKNRIWAGTQGGLNWSLNNPDSLYFNHITTKQGLPNNFILGIKEDHSGNLWMSTFRGIAKLSNNKSNWLFEGWDNSLATEPDPFDPIIISYTEHDGIQGNEFNQGASFIDNDGNIYFGGFKGITIFHPDSLKSSQFNPGLILTDFKIFNKSVKISDSTENINNKISRSGNTWYLPKQITYLENIELTYKESVFSFQFSSLDFTKPAQIDYSYKMEGFEQDWNYVGNQNTATYTNLDAGIYTFRVKGTNTDGIWSSEEVKLKITILPPFWKTRWFIVLMVLAFLLALTFTVWRIIIVQKRNAHAEREKIELQLKTIKNQIDPHFAFNALNMIGSLVYKGDPDAVYDYFTRFAKLIRSTLQDSEKIARPLGEELEFVENYIEIQKTRFKGKFDFTLKVDEGTDLKTEVPKMIIQTHAENAIKHGLMHKKEGGQLLIDIEQEKDQLVIYIEDNGIGRKKAAQISKGNTGKGMQIIDQIFTLYNKLSKYKIDQQIFDLKDKNGTANGTKVIITLGH